MIKFTKKVEAPKKTTDATTNDENRFDKINKAAKKLRNKSDKTLFENGKKEGK